MEEMIIYQGQTDINDFLEDINDTNIFKCKVCESLGSNKHHDFLCTNSLSDYYDKDVERCKGCVFFKKESSEYVYDDETQSLFQ